MTYLNKINSLYVRSSPVGLASCLSTARITYGDLELVIKNTEPLTPEFGKQFCFFHLFLLGD